LLLAVLVIFVGLQSWKTYVERQYVGIAVRDRDTMTVEGEGKVTVRPDIVKISLGVATEALTVREAQMGNTKKMNDITAMVKQQGVKDEDIKTENYSIYPRHQWQDNVQRLAGYTVSQSLAIKIRDLDKIGDILARAGEFGANDVGGIQFTVDDPSAFQDEAREKAIADAQDKAEALARQLGLIIVKVVSFSESGGGYPVPMYDAGIPAYAVKAERAPAPDIEEGSQDVTVNVNVIFEVR